MQSGIESCGVILQSRGGAHFDISSFKIGSIYGSKRNAIEKVERVGCEYEEQFSY
jgi:hypothetical protein